MKFMNKIKIVSILLGLSCLLLPVIGLADSPVLPMSLYGTIKWNTTVNMPVDTILKAYCGNTNTEIGTVTLTTVGQYGVDNTSLPVNNCASVNIYVQASYGGEVTDKQDTGLTFASTVMTEHDIVFTSSSAQPEIPIAPSGLTDTVDSQTTITLSWVDNSTNETGFAIYQEGVKIFTTDANVVTYQITGLTAGTEYHFYVMAVNETIYSDPSEDVSPTTLAAAETADSVSGIVLGNDIDPIYAVYVNDSATETLLKDTNANITDSVTGIFVVSDIAALSSITSSSANIIVAKQAIALGTASGASTTSTTFDTNVASTAGVIETTVFVPVDTTTTEAQRIAIVIPELTLIKDSDGQDLAAVEIRPPSVQNSTVVGTAIQSSFSESTAPVSVKAAINIPASVSGIKFYAANGTTAQYIDICMDKSGFGDTSASDIQVYYSVDGTSWAIDGYAQTKTFTDNQFCFQTNHLSSFAGAIGSTKSTACTQSGAPSNASYTVANVTVTWLGSAWSTASDCSWSCDSGYSQVDNTCVILSTVSGGAGGAPLAPTMPSTTTGEVTATRTAGGKTTFTTTANTEVIVKVLAYAVSASTNIAVSEIATTAEAVTTAVAALPSGKAVVGNYVYNITATSAGEAVTTFSKNVTITLTYTDEQIEGLKESSLVINYWDEDESEWVALDTTVYKTTNKVIAKTKHFTYFAIIGEEGVEEVEVMTIAELKAEIARIAALIADLQVQLAELIGVPTYEDCTITSFTRNLKQGMSGDDVKCLQIVLNASSDTRVAVSGVGSPGNETNYFGSLTKAAVVKFQEKYASDVLAPWDLTEGTGYVGSTSLEKLNDLLGG